MSRRRPSSVSRHAIVGLSFALATLARSAAAQTAAPDTTPRATRVIPRGSVLTADDIMVVGDSLPQALPLGWVTRRVVQAGEALRPPAIGRAPVVHTGRSVSLIAGTSTVRIVRSGAALEDGAPGDTIRVRFGGGATVAAVVRDSNTVLPVSPIRP